MTPSSIDSRPRSAAWRNAFIAVLATASLALAGCGAETAEQIGATDAEADDEDVLGPVDLGWGPGVNVEPPGARAKRLSAGRPGASAAMNGGPLAHTMGAFGPVFNWPIIPVHLILLPDGRVMTYGTNDKGEQGALLHYTVWDPALGTGPESMLTLANVTATNIFCSTQLLLPQTGEVLLLGGSWYDGRGEQFDANHVNIFSGSANTLTRQTGSMAYARWYGTAVTTASGDQVLMGGKDVKGKTESRWRKAAVETYASTPEIYRTGQGWHTLTGATSEAAYGSEPHSWWYPRAWQAPDGSIFVLSLAGSMFSLNAAGDGSVSRHEASVPGPAWKMPSVMFAPGKILTLRRDRKAYVIDLTGSAPVTTATQPPSAQRMDQTATLLADGTVWVNGGSVTSRSLLDAYYHSEIWTPDTGAWTTTASAAKARLYHSTAMLLPDGSVITGGGGAPGPVTNLNAEIYYPAYLFDRGGSGEPALRPTILSSPARQLEWGEVVAIGVEEGTDISRVTLVRTGSVTHGFNNEQRFMRLDFAQSGSRIDVSMPSDRNLAPPGFYLLFVFNSQGVPSVAKVLHLNAS